MTNWQHTHDCLFPFSQDALLVKPTDQQASRAANLVCIMLRYRREVDREELDPVSHPLQYGYFMDIASFVPAPPVLAVDFKGVCVCVCCYIFALYFS